MSHLCAQDVSDHLCLLRHGRSPCLNSLTSRRRCLLDRSRVCVKKNVFVGRIRSYPGTLLSVPTVQCASKMNCRRPVNTRKSGDLIRTQKLCDKSKIKTKTKTKQQKANTSPNKKNPSTTRRPLITTQHAVPTRLPLSVASILP